MTTDRLIFTGTGDALGVPRVYCSCRVCDEARRSGRNRRSRCSALLVTEIATLWLDCSPDWRSQMEAASQRSAPHILLTHAHHDHIGGVPDLADSSRWTGERPHLYAPSTVLETVFRRYPWTESRFAVHPISEAVRVVGYDVRAQLVNHGYNGTAYAYRLSRPGYEWGYCPDSINLTPDQKDFLQGLDLLVLGTAHVREDAPAEKRSLYDMTEAAALLGEIRPRRTYFTHLSHSVDVRKTYPLPPATALAHDGMSVDL